MRKVPIEYVLGNRRNYCSFKNDKRGQMGFIEYLTLAGFIGALGVFAYYCIEAAYDLWKYRREK